MADYYIRTLDRETSRGPFDPNGLLTLAEAGQISETTLYFDETRGEWLPIGLNDALKQQVFPERRKLKLNLVRNSDASGSEPTAETEAASQAERQAATPCEAIEVKDLLAAADRPNQLTQQRQKSLEAAAAMASPAMGGMLLLSSVALLLPHGQSAIESLHLPALSTLLSRPLVWIGLLDLLFATLLFLAAAGVYSWLRVRAAIALSMGIFALWSMSDVYLFTAFTVAASTLCAATFVPRLPVMRILVAFGIAANCVLVYLTAVGRMSDFYAALPATFF
jgi:hypothetical protein